MKCEECLPLIEEYFDGELKGRTGQRVAAHLTACAACANELAEFERDAEIYARYERDLEVGPASWNIIRARIEQERDARPAESRRRSWLARLFGTGKGFRPALVAALLLIAVGVTVGIIYLNSRGRQSELASHPQRQSVAPAPNVTDKVTPQRTGDENANVVAANEDREKNSSNRTAATAATTPRATRRDATLARLPKSANRQGRRPSADAPVKFEEASADRSDIIADVRGSAPEAPGDFDFEMARHAERAEVLLRSFRNARPETNARRALDLSYEKENARKLLYQNIALRRDAEARGDQTASELLGTLEPILLDIAHLPNRARPNDVRPIEERMKKKEIVAALQVRTLVAAN